MITSEELEESIAALERILKLNLTIIDNEGVFHPEDRSIFTPERASHRKNGCCQIGFSEKCIDNCRYRMNRICLEKENPFSDVCWKGVRQLVVPIGDGLRHFGMLYAGMWKSQSGAAEGLPSDFYSAYRALKPLSPERENSLISILRVFADGLGTCLSREKLLRDSSDLRSFRIVRFLDEHLTNRFGLPDLAENLGLSIPHTSVFVKKMFGCTFSSLVRKRRVRKAKYLLKETDLPLKRIAELCGFSSEFHLGRVFKEVEGRSPGKAR